MTQDQKPWWLDQVKKAIHPWGNPEEEELDVWRKFMEDARILAIQECLDVVEKVELVNDSNGRYNACQEIKEKLREMLEIHDKAQRAAEMVVNDFGEAMKNLSEK